MMIALLFVLDLAAALPSGPVTLTPGQQLGPVTLGMSSAELERLGASPKEGDRSELSLGPLQISLRKGRVASISGNFGYYEKTRFQIGASSFALNWQIEGGETAEKMVKLFSGCRRPYRSGEERLWRTWRCNGVRIDERLADGDPEITIEVHR
jgi:hypothetical protein